MSVEPITISDGIARAVVHPGAGASIGCYDLIDGQQSLPLFRASPDPGRSGVFALGCNVLVPWSNRISGGGFTAGGMFHALPANLAGEPFPIHGNGFQAEWTVMHAGSSHIQLTLDSEGPGPYRYSAALTYRLTDGALAMTLGVRNCASVTLPYGVGFHLWFPRTSGTTIQAVVNGVWLEDERHLPLRHEPIAKHSDWNFGIIHPLPRSWINNAFTGWDGNARIAWPDGGVILDARASKVLGTPLIYSPSAAASCFCLETVSHPVDVHNKRNDAAAGLIDLSPEQQLSAGCVFRPTRIQHAKG